MSLTSQWQPRATKISLKARAVSISPEAERVEVGLALMRGTAEGEWRKERRGHWVFYVRLTQPKGTPPAVEPRQLGLAL
jgi:hypothetical protein